VDVDHIDAQFDIGECSRLREQIVRHGSVEHAHSVVSSISALRTRRSLANPKEDQ